MEQLLAADCEATMHAVAVQGTQIRKGSRRNKEALVMMVFGVAVQQILLSLLYKSKAVVEESGCYWENY
jgi:hypothetical protein